MTKKCLNLCNTMIFKKNNNFCLYKIRTIVIKNTKKKPKCKNKEIEPKIINNF